MIYTHMRNFFKKRSLLFIVAVLALALPILIFATSQEQRLKQYASTTHQVTIQNFTMSPPSLTVNVGDTVTWTNQDSDSHDAHSTQEVFRSPLLKKGESWSHTFAQAGTFEYFCTPHQSMMKGYKIIVLPAAEAPTPLPTVTPTLAPESPTPTSPPPKESLLPTDISQPTTPPAVVVEPSDGTSVAVTLQLHGIGSAGDSINPNDASSNKSPREPERLIALIILDSAGQQVQEPSGKVTYDQVTGDFKGIVELGSNFTPGTYTIKVRMKKYLTKKLVENFAIQSGTSILPVAALVVGDIDSNNMLDAQDYNALLACFTEDVTIKKCEVNQQLKSDLNDDGAINTLDANLLQREFVVGKGD